MIADTRNQHRLKKVEVDAHLGPASGKCSLVNGQIVKENTLYFCILHSVNLQATAQSKHDQQHRLCAINKPEEGGGPTTHSDIMAGKWLLSSLHATVLGQLENHSAGTLKRKSRMHRIPFWGRMITFG